VKTKLAWVLAGVIMAAGTAFAAEPEFTLSKDMQSKIDGIPKDIVAKMDTNMPTEAAAKVEKPRKLVVFIASKGYYHDSIPVAALALQKMGNKTKAWETTLTDDEKLFTKENLAKFDGIFMDNTVGEHPSAGADQKQGRQDFLDYIKAGHGLSGTHAATDCNHPWPEYLDMIGGEFQNHPFFQIGVKIEDPDSPITAAFGGKGFSFDDEIYQFHQLNNNNKKTMGYTRDNLHVLLSFNGENTKQWDTGDRPLKKNPPRPDNDYAVAWTRNYGEGRVFYCSLGHNRTDFANSVLLKFYLAGIQYSLGDLKADATPSAKLPADRKMGEAPKWDDKASSLVNK
jgi:type 1 glutamine amidotransferase